VRGQLLGESNKRERFFFVLVQEKKRQNRKRAKNERNRPEELRMKLKGKKKEEEVRREAGLQGGSSEEGKRKVGVGDVTRHGSRWPGR